MPKEDATLEAKVRAAQSVIHGIILDFEGSGRLCGPDGEGIAVAFDDALSALLGAETLLSRSKSCDKDETED